MENFNPALFMENNPSILCPQTCYKYHSMRFRKGQLEKRTNKKSVDTPEWNGNGGTVGRKNDLCSHDAEGMPGLPHNWHSQAKKANALYGILVVYAKKKNKIKKSKSPRALAHTHAQRKKKEINTFQ